MEEKHLMGQAFAEGKSPSALLYELARQRGFTGGRQPQPRPNIAYDPKIVEQLQQTQRGQQAGATLSGVGGAPGQGLSVDQIANMCEHDFDRLIEKMGGLHSGTVRRAFGG